MIPRYHFFSLIQLMLDICKMTVFPIFQVTFFVCLAVRACSLSPHVRKIHMHRRATTLLWGYHIRSLLTTYIPAYCFGDYIVQQIGKVDNLSKERLQMQSKLTSGSEKLCCEPWWCNLIFFFYAGCSFYELVTLRRGRGTEVVHRRKQASWSNGLLINCRFVLDSVYLTMYNVLTQKCLYESLIDGAP